MDADIWKKEYQRLCTAYGRALNVEQAGVYFAALSLYPGFIVGKAITAAIRESKAWPSAADLVERARTSMAENAAPRGMCDQCHGDLWEQYTCAGVSAPDTQTKPAPVNRHEWCGRDWVHAGHDYAMRCRQCRPRQEVA